MNTLLLSPNFKGCFPEGNLGNPRSENWSNAIIDFDKVFN